MDPLRQSAQNKMKHNIKKKKLFVYFWLHWVPIAACRLSLAVASRGCCLVAVLQLLISVASLVVEHRL